MDWLAIIVHLGSFGRIIIVIAFERTGVSRIEGFHNLSFVLRIN
jgi:hypothetical protein